MSYSAASALRWVEVSYLNLHWPLHSYTTRMWMRCSALCWYVAENNWYMWCDQAKWVLCRALSNFRFVVYLVKQPESFVLLKTSSKSDLEFKRFRQFCPAENIKIQKEFQTKIACTVSQNQYTRHTTHSTWSPHIYTSVMQLRIAVEYEQNFSHSLPCLQSIPINPAAQEHPIGWGRQNSEPLQP